MVGKIEHRARAGESENRAGEGQVHVVAIASRNTAQNERPVDPVGGERVTIAERHRAGRTRLQLCVIHRIVFNLSQQKTCNF